MVREPRRIEPALINGLDQRVTTAVVILKKVDHAN
jgi:hypothetical protein